MEISNEQLALVNERIAQLLHADSFYGKRLREHGIDGVSSPEDFKKLPFSEKKDLRDAYPLGLMSVPEEKIVRMHSSSGTTGKPVIIPYTAKDVEDWATQFARCYAMAGVTNRDRVQITPGYGLWTAGIGFQAGCEKLGIDAYDIYGLTEVYGPGIGISCDAHDGIHYWDDFVYIEIIDPQTGENLPDGEWGEIVITTLRKEGAPLIRFRTHDLSRILPGDCPCGSKFPRLDTIQGRTDDMVKIKGVNLFPSQIEEILKTFPEVSSEYQMHISHLDGKDTMRLYVETNGSVDFLDLAKRIAECVKSRIGFTPLVKVVEIGVLPRSEKKTKRVIDTRYE